MTFNVRSKFEEEVLRSRRLIYLVEMSHVS